MSVSVVGGSTVARGSSEAALLSEDESDCIDWERCLFLLVDATSSSPALLDGDAAGDGRLIAVKIKSHPGGSHRLVIEGGLGGSQTFPPMEKHLCNAPASLVLDALRGLAVLNSQLAVDAHNKGSPASPSRHTLTISQSSTSLIQTAQRLRSSAGAALATNPPTLPSWVRTPSRAIPASHPCVTGHGILSGRIPLLYLGATYRLISCTSRRLRECVCVTECRSGPSCHRPS